MITLFLAVVLLFYTEMEPASVRKAMEPFQESVSEMCLTETKKHQEKWKEEEKDLEEEEIQKPGEDELQNQGENESQKSGKDELQYQGESDIQKPGEHDEQTPDKSETQQSEESDTQQPGENGTQQPGENGTQQPEEDDTQPPEEKIYYTITFDLAGGTVSSGEKTISQQVLEGELPDLSAVDPIVPVKTGYTFQGWAQEDGTLYAFDQPILSDLLLMASWKPVSYQVKFHSNGGNGEMPDQEFIYGEEKKLPKNQFTRKGYIFSGWKIGTEVYQEGEKVKNLSDQEGAVVILKAVWKQGQYKVRFMANGGKGKMESQGFAYGKSKKLSKNQFTRKGYSFTGWNTKKDGKGKSYKNGQSVINLTSKNDGVVTLYAMWKGNPYKVKYIGNGATSGKMEASQYVYGKKGKLRGNKFKRKGYTFVKWNTKKNGKGKSYKNGQSISNLTAKKNGVVTLYAIWKGNPYKVKYIGNGATSGKMEASRHEYGKKKKLSANKFKKKGYKFVKWNTKKNGKGKSFKNKAFVKNLTMKKNKVIPLYAQWKMVNYTITYRTNGGKLPSSVRKRYNLKTKSFLLPKPTRKGYDFDGWYKDKKWKGRLDKIKQGRTGNLILYAKWVKCTRKPRTDSAKITSCKATATNTIKVKASITKRIASTDDYYYLVCVDPISGQPGKKVAKAYKGKSVSFTVKIKNNQGYITTKYGVAVKKGRKYHLMSAPSFVKYPEKAAKNKMAYNPGETKKGIQFSNSVNEIYACDAKQYFLNLTVTYIYDNPTVSYQYNGKTYYFDALGYYQDIVRECNRNNVTVTMQVLLDWKDGQTDLIHPKARIPGVPFYSWNIYKKSAREKMEAMFCYLGKVFSQKDCYVSNWVLGNEVNNPSAWNCAGSMTDQEYFESYAYAFRSLYYGIKSQYANAHIFICIDNYWNASGGRRYTARQVVMNFPEYLNKIQKGLNWNLAYHAYSFPLTDTRFWNGGGATGDVWSTPSITMNNIHVLTNFIRDTYGSSVRVILSEQGFSAVPGESVQAAAIAYGYYIAACDPMIDAFIIRSYDDDPVEVAMGLQMGILGRQAFQIFRNMDSERTFAYTNRYLWVIGASSWEQIVPYYHKERIWKMYREP